jgi:hypothetical protein
LAGKLPKPVKKPPKTKARDPVRLERVEALRNVGLLQRIAVEALVHSATPEDAVQKIKALNPNARVSSSSLRAWMKQPKFMRAWKAREAEVAKLVSRTSVIVNAQNVFNEAMQPQPIVSRKTGEIVGHKRELGHALTANEQMGKAVGAFTTDHDGKTVVVIDIDFSGRKGGPVQERVAGEEVIEAEFSEPTATPIEPHIVDSKLHDFVTAKEDEPPKESSWLD